MNTPNQRRIVLIDHRFQLRLAAAFILLQILLTALFAAGLFIFMDSELHADLASAHASYESLNQMLLPIVLTLAVFSVTLSVVLTTVFVILISHKIAGPMYRFRTVLESLAHRRFESRTRIRPDDQLGDLASSLDKAMQTVRTDIHELHQGVWRLRESHAKADAASFEAQIAAMEKTLDAWEKS
jgi:signal transduction histidine kinase